MDEKYKGYRIPKALIGYAVRLYFRYKGVRGAMEQATDLRNHMSFEDKHSFVFYSLRYLPLLK